MSASKQDCRAHAMPFNVNPCLSSYPKALDVLSCLTCRLPERQKTLRTSISVPSSYADTALCVARSEEVFRLNTESLAKRNWGETEGGQGRIVQTADYGVHNWESRDTAPCQHCLPVMLPCPVC